MSVAVKWFNPNQSIVHYLLDGRWDLNDFEEALEQGFTLMETRPHVVDMILEFTDKSGLPDGTVLMWKRMMKAAPKNTGKIAFVGGNAMVKKAVRIFRDTSKNFNHLIIVSDTLDQALTVLAQYSPGQTKILVIEDEPSLREGIVETLGYEGYETLHAPNGKVGLELARKHLPDLIICDIAMPEMDGFAVLDGVRQSESTTSIPFIFLTARADRTFMRHGMELGADDYLTKPFTNAELLSAIKARLERRAITRKTDL